MNKDEGEYELSRIYHHVPLPVWDTASLNVWNEQAISWFTIPGSYEIKGRVMLEA